MQKRSKSKTPWIKQGPLKTFLFFLGFSALIWLMVQFSKYYIESIEFPLDYVNIPQDKLLDESNPGSLVIRVRNNGFNLARYKLLPPEITIDISEARQEQGVLVYDLEQQKPAILSQLNLNYEDAIFLYQQLELNYEQKAVKTINIVPNMELRFAVGYSALEEIRLEPDTVRVSGPQSILDTLQEVSTVPVRINNISQDLNGTIKLDTRGLERVTFFNDEVRYSLRTDKFTEGRVTIPIEPINVPDNHNVVIFPKEVVVYYQVSLQDFDKIKPQAFKVIVDFRNSLPREGSLLAHVVQKPTLVNNVRLSENRVQYVVKR